MILFKQIYLIDKNANQINDVNTNIIKYTMVSILIGCAFHKLKNKLAKKHQNNLVKLQFSHRVE